MKSIYFLFILILFVNLQAKSASSEDYLFRISKEEMDAKGLGKLSDIFFLVNGFDFATIDGYNHSIGYNVGDTYQTQNYSVFINENEIRFNDFEEININTIPINYTSINEIIIKNDPLILGNFQIHIFTKENIEKLSISGKFDVGNETGDPGPYKYTKYYSPNVDRVGFYNESNVALKLHNLELNCSFIDEEITYTDFAIRKRIHGMTSEGYGSVERNSIFASCGYLLKNNNLKLSFFQNKNEHEFLFFAPLGREVPINNTSYQTTFSFENLVSKNICGNVTYYEHLIETIKNPENISIDLLEKNWNGSVDLNNKNNRFQIRNRLKFEMNKLSFFKNENQIEENIFGISSNIKKIWSNCYETSIAVNLIKNEKEWHQKFQLLNEMKFKKNYFARLSFTYEHFDSKYKKNAWNYLIDDGELFEEKRIEIIDDTESRKSKIFNSSLELRKNYRSGFCRFQCKFSKQKNILFTEQDFALQKNYACFSDDLKITDNNEGILSEVSIEIEKKSFYKWNQNFYARYIYLIESNELFKNKFKERPQLTINYSVLYSYYNDFVIHNQIRWEAETEWNEYRRISGMTIEGKNILPVILEHKINDKFIWNSVITKKFWKKQIFSSLIIRNVLNNKINYHPIGASFDLTFFIKISYKFDIIN